MRIDPCTELPDTKGNAMTDQPTTTVTLKVSRSEDAVDAIRDGYRNLIISVLPTPARTADNPDIDATLNRPATTTPSFADARPTGNVPGLRPNPGMLRALMQPVLFLELLEPVGAFEVGDVVAAQFWGEGRVMMTPLPAAAARGRIPTTFPANQIHAEIAGPKPAHYPPTGGDAQPFTGERYQTVPGAEIDSAGDLHVSTSGLGASDQARVRAAENAAAALMHTSGDYRLATSYPVPTHE